jgi:hypothetical protein
MRAIVPPPTATKIWHMIRYPSVYSGPRKWIINPEVGIIFYGHTCSQNVNWNANNGPYFISSGIFDDESEDNTRDT